MKKLLLLLALMGMVAVGCSKDDMPEDIFFGLDKESVIISPDGGSVEVVVYSNYKWEISGTSDWCMPSVINGNANEDGQKVTFSADVSFDDREATFWFRCADENIKFVVSQKLKAVIIPDANNSFNISAEGGIAILNYQTSVACEVIIPEDAQDWITIAPATRGLVSESISLDVAENTAYDPRSAVVKVVAKDNAELVVEYTINQEQKPTYCLYYTSSNGEIVEPYDNTAFDATILSNTYEDGVGVIEFDAPINMIGGFAFANCNSLTSITIPDSVTTIGKYAFDECSSLQEFKGKFASEDGRCLIIEGVLNSFAPVGLTEYNIPDDVTTIGDFAFHYCGSLTSVIIPNSVTTIGDYAFCHCSSIESITIGDSVTTIGRGAFEGCSSLTSVTIPNSVTTIETFAFQYCSSLTSITIPGSVTTIGGCAFYDCSSLTSVTIPNSVTTIENHAFCACSSLTSVIIPNSVTTIGPYAFSGCSSLISVTIPNSVTTIEESAFGNCSSLTSVTIPDSVTMLGESTFNNCSSLQEFNGKFASEDGRCLIIEGVLNSFAPAGLTEYNIPNNVTTIGGFAFANCNSLTSITIPENVNMIGDYAFYDCSSLTSVYCKPTTPPAGSYYMFSYKAARMKIYVPMQSVSNYRSAEYWKDYADAIVGYNF